MFNNIESSTLIYIYIDFIHQNIIYYNEECKWITIKKQESKGTV